MIVWHEFLLVHFMVLLRIVIFKLNGIEYLICFDGFYLVCNKKRSYCYLCYDMIMELMQKLLIPNEIYSNSFLEFRLLFRIDP